MNFLLLTQELRSKRTEARIKSPESSLPDLALAKAGVQNLDRKVESLIIKMFLSMII
jgi:hypothetical protein